MGKALGAAVFKAVLITVCAILAGCADKSARETAVGPVLTGPDPVPDTNPRPVTTVPDSVPDPVVAALNSRWALGLDAAAFRGNVASLERIGALMDSAGRRMPRFETLPADAGNRASSQAAWAALGALTGKTGSGMTGPGEIGAGNAVALTLPLAFSKSPARALAGGSGGGRTRIEGSDAAAAAEPFTADISFDSDTSWFVYDDSAHGRIHWIHLFHDADGDLYSLVRDSLVYQWPFAKEAPVVLASHTHLLRYDGVVTEFGLSDGDGDGDLNGSDPGAGLRRRKEWVAAIGDTAWKTVWLVEYGRDPEDMAGEGTPVAFADSVFVKGMAVAGSRTFDGDGDGFVLRAAGGRMVIRTEVFHLDADGARIHSGNAYGPGADGDFFAAGDNPLYPFSLTVLSATDDTLSVSVFGDGDGDGFYADPNPGAANRVWETGRYLDRDGCGSWTDSLVKSLHGLGNPEDDRLIFYRADAVRDDGTRSHLMNRPRDSLGFGGADLGTGEAESGTFVREERYAEARPGGLERLWRKDVWDQAAQAWSWEERRYLRGGDSAVSTGNRGEARREGVYAEIPDGRTRASGWYDAGAGRFRDTLSHAGTDGNPGSMEYSEGVYRAADGTGDYTRRHAPAAGGDAAVTRLILAPHAEGGRSVSVVLDGDSSVYRLRGDSAEWTYAEGDTAITFTSLSLGGGSHFVRQRVLDGAGKPLAEGWFTFLPDGSGKGSLRLHGEGAARLEVDILFAGDGSVHLLQSAQAGLPAAAAARIEEARTEAAH